MGWPALRLLVGVRGGGGGGGVSIPVLVKSLLESLRDHL